MSFTNAPRFSCGSNESPGGLNSSYGIISCWIFLSCRLIQGDLSCIFSGVPDKIIFCLQNIRRISSSLAQEEMEATHIMITPFNFFDWKEEMVIQLRDKGLFRVTMGNEVEPNSAVEKAKYFNKMDEAYGLICLRISRELLFHLESLKSPKEVWEN